MTALQRQHDGPDFLGLPGVVPVEIRIGKESYLENGTRVVDITIKDEQGVWHGPFRTADTMRAPYFVTNDAQEMLVVDSKSEQWLVCAPCEEMLRFLRSSFPGYRHFVHPQTQ